MPETVLACADVAHIEALAHHNERAPPVFQSVVDAVGYVRQGQAGLGEHDEQGHLPLWIGQPRGGRDEADLAAHGLQDQDRICRGRTGIFFVGILQRQRPVAGRTPVARGVIDELELRVAHVVVDRFGDAGSEQVQPPFARPLHNLVGRVH